MKFPPRTVVQKSLQIRSRCFPLPFPPMRKLIATLFAVVESRRRKHFGNSTLTLKYATFWQILWQLQCKLKTAGWQQLFFAVDSTGLRLKTRCDAMLRVRWPKRYLDIWIFEYQITTRAARSDCQRWAELFKLCTNYTLANLKCETRAMCRFCYCFFLCLCFLPGLCNLLLCEKFLAKNFFGILVALPDYLYYFCVLWRIVFRFLGRRRKLHFNT